VRQGGTVIIRGVVVTAPDNIFPNGWLVLKDGKKTLARLRLGTKMKMVRMNLSVGTHSIKAIYQGDRWCEGSASEIFKLRVVGARG
jgi:hypothetical protein